MTDKTVLQLTLRRPWGEPSLNVAINLTDTRDCPALMPHPPDPFSGMDNAVRVMKRREYSREQIRLACAQLAERLGDLMEDDAGWHGEERERAVKENLR